MSTISIIKHHSKNFLTGLALITASAAACGSEPELRLCENNGATDIFGYIKQPSVFNVEDTVSRLEHEISSRGLKVLSIIDHAANAQSVDKELVPTQLIIFGNPNIGTQLMQSNPSIGLDLPQKYLVWEVSDGSTCIAYNKPDYLKYRHNIFGKEELLGRISNALKTIATAASTDAESTLD